MPHVVATLVPGMRIVVAPLALGIDDVANRAQIDDLARFTVNDVVGFGLAERLGEAKLGIIVHVLIGEAQERVVINGAFDGFYQFFTQFAGQIDELLRAARD